MKKKSLRQPGMIRMRIWQTRADLFSVHTEPDLSSTGTRSKITCIWKAAWVRPMESGGWRRLKQAHVPPTDREEVLSRRCGLERMRSMRFWRAPIMPIKRKTAENAAGAEPVNDQCSSTARACMERRRGDRRAIRKPGQLELRHLEMWENQEVPWLEMQGDLSMQEKRRKVADRAAELAAPKEKWHQRFGNICW